VARSAGVVGVPGWWGELRALIKVSEKAGSSQSGPFYSAPFTRSASLISAQNLTRLLWLWMGEDRNYLDRVELYAPEKRQGSRVPQASASWMRA
jgi:hypothetical protein